MRRLKINLALQGGGAHGAFTWGVLDRLLEEDEIEISGISGTSAGALNGAALKAGFARGGRQAARENLDWFWGEIDRADDLNVGHWIASFWPDIMLRTMRAVTPYAALSGMSHMFSPYDYGPFYSDPLRKIAESLHFEHICSPKGPALFVSATNVRTGKIRVFSASAITIDALMASACLPNVFRTIEIMDPATGKLEGYWDGGYSGNPALFPLYDKTLPDDIVIVNINPIVRETLPRSASEILNRINEISFNSSLLSELRSINFVRRLIADNKLPPGTMKEVKVHMISDDKLMNSLTAETKLMPTTGLLGELKTAGRAAASRFLREHAHKIGKSNSIDLAGVYS